MRQFPGDRITLLVVWERVLLTDTHPPPDRELGRIADSRAAQFWDRNRWVSRAIGPPIVTRGQDNEGRRYRMKDGILWDTVAVYPAGVRWDEGSPLPAYTGGPVVNVALGLRQALREAIADRGSKPGTGN